MMRMSNSWAFIDSFRSRVKPYPSRGGLGGAGFPVDDGKTHPPPGLPLDGEGYNRLAAPRSFVATMLPTPPASARSSPPAPPPPSAAPSTHTPPPTTDPRHASK